MIRLCARGWLIVCVSVAAACVTAAPQLAPGRSGLMGRLRLVPHEGVDPHASGNAYGDLRYRHAQRVDYDRPGFAVVYVDPAADERATSSRSDAVAPPRVVIRDGRLGPRISPSHLALRVGGRVRIVNTSAQARVVSIPTDGVVRSIPSGDEVALEVGTPGPHAVFLLGVEGVESIVFAAPGRYTIPRSTGEYQLMDLPPGSTLVHVWHPRFPPATERVDLAPDTVTSVDLELGVGHSHPARTASAGLTKGRR